MRSFLVILLTWTVGSYGSEEQILGSVHSLSQSVFVESNEISEFSSAPLRLLGKPIFSLGMQNIHPLNSNFTVKGEGIRRAPEVLHGNIPYVFPPPARLPLPGCFYNPSGYVCCNRELYHFIEDTFREILARPNFNPCNIQSSVNHLHLEAEKRFNTSMEAFVGLDDFAQKVRFRGTLACKLEVEGKFIMMYSSPVWPDNVRRKRDTSDSDPSSLHNEHSAFF